MKKIFCFLLSLLLCSCTFFHNNYSQIGIEKMEKLVSCIEENDSNILKELLCTSMLNNDKNIDNEIEELFSYYHGNSHSIISSGGTQTYEQNDHGTKSEVLSMSYIVKTDVTDYLFFVSWCIRDDFDSDNIGIGSLYVLESNKNPYPSQIYYGDGTDSCGIFTDRLYGGWYLDSLVEFFKTKDSEKLLDSFVASVQSSLTTADANKCFLLFDGNYSINNSFVHIYKELEEGYDIVSYYVKDDGISVLTYLLRLKWCIRDQAGNSGAKSLYVSVIEENLEMIEPSWESLDWVEGINIIE